MLNVLYSVDAPHAHAGASRERKTPTKRASSMILKGSQRGYGGNLAPHLSNARENDHVAVSGMICVQILGIG